ncbi:hypothetical protein [Arthrobacter sp. MAHUQ-56]
MPKLRGEEHPASKLTEQAVREIRAAYAPGKVGQRWLADMYGVSQTMIARILAGKAWRHVR